MQRFNNPLGTAILGNPDDLRPFCANKLMLGSAQAPDQKSNPTVLNRISELELQFETNPQDHDVLNDLAHLYLQTAAHDEAAYMFFLLEHFYAEDISGHIGQTKVHLNRGDLNTALMKAQRTVDLFPTSPRALATIGAVLFLKGEYQLACSYYEQASILSKDPPAWILSAHGLVLRTLDQTEDAKGLLEQATALDPSNGGAWINLGLVLSDLGDHQSAIRCYDQALIFLPNDELARLNKALALLTIGKYKQGWLDYEARWIKLDVQHRLSQPLWSGQSLDSESLIIYGEQGLGDEIMFSSCIPDVLKLVRHLLIECDDRLYTLFVRSFPQATVISRSMMGDPTWQSSVRLANYQIPIGSLPLFFRESANQFYRSSPYLKAEPSRISFWKTKLGELSDGLKIGISWRGGTIFSRRERRSIPLREFTPILQTEGCTFVNLQYDTLDDELAAIEELTRVKIHDFSNVLSDYDETAALIEAVDLVISVQTSVVHLSGALGHAAWVMLPSSPEWRYGACGVTMPWYSSVRSFRQTRRNEWTDVIRSVATYLSTQVGTRMEG